MALLTFVLYLVASKRLTAILWLLFFGAVVDYPDGIVLNGILTFAINSETATQSSSTNLLVSLILSLKNLSHACVFTSRIPATISVMRFIRRSDMTAVSRRSFPDKYDRNPPNGTRRNKKMIPISACQPMKYHNNGTATQTSKMATTRRKNCLAACSIL